MGILSLQISVQRSLKSFEFLLQLHVPHANDWRLIQDSLLDLESRKGPPHGDSVTQRLNRNYCHEVMLYLCC